MLILRVLLFWFGLFSSYLTAYLALVYGLTFLGLLLPVVSSVLPRFALVVGQWV